ncbi:MAG TPA: hypothetical protein VKN14_15635 [Flavobacteriaceae bacterium]|nr:hypothetical protein [Flavobacteriaceae bacterium]
MNRAIIILFLIFLSGCGKEINLSEKERNWNPYQVGEILVFQSSEMELDTIFIKEIADNIFPSSTGPLKYYNESLWVYVKHTDPNYDRKLTNKLLEIQTGTPEKPSEINFGILAKNAVFYDSYKTIEELEKLNELTIETPLGKFTDVLEIEDTEGMYSERDNFIDRIYWSKSNGYLRFEKRNGKVWELIKKYVP